MSARWLIHSRDRTFGPWTSIQVRDELRAGRIDPFDMACKEGSTVKRPLVEVDEIFQSSRVQMAELVEVSGVVEEQKATRYTKRATSEPEPVPVEQPLANTGTSPPARAVEKPAAVVERPAAVSQAPISDRPRPSQFQALAAAARLDPPGQRGEARKPKQYFVTDSTGRSYGPLSSGEVMKLWHSGRLDSRSVVERGSSSKRISIQKFVDFYQKAAPSGIAFMTRVNNKPMNARFVTATRSSGSKPMMFGAAFLAIGALFFLGMTMRNRLPTQVSKYLPKSKTAPEVQRFDLKAIDTIGGGSGQNDGVSGTQNPARVQMQQPASVNMNEESIQIRPTQSSKKNQKQPPQRKLPSRQQQPVYRAATPAVQRSQPKQNPATATTAGRVAVVAPPVAVGRPTAQPPPPPKPRPKTQVQAKPLVDGATMTLSGYHFSQSDLSQCDGKCKISMTGPNGPVTAVFFKEALGDSFQGKSSVTLTGIIRKTASGWSIIVGFAR